MITAPAFARLSSTGTMPHRLGPRSVRAAAVAAIPLIGWFDYVTGPDLGLSLLYLVPGWSLGLVDGFAVAGAAAVSWFAADVAWREADYVPISGWNAFTRLVIYLFFAFAATMELPVWAAVLGAVLGSGLLGAVVERTMIRPMLGEAPISVFMVTVGLASILVGVVELVWTADPRRLPEFMPSDPIMVGEAFLARHARHRVRVGLQRLGRGLHRIGGAGIANVERDEHIEVDRAITFECLGRAPARFRGRGLDRRRNCTR